MDDLISRKQAIDACMKYNGYGSVWACIMGDIKQLPSVTIKDTADKIKVTNCNDNISRQAICDALDIVFAARIKSAGFDSYETADRDTQLVCDGIMKAIDVVLDQPTVDHLAEVSKNGDLISRQALLRQIDIDADGESGYYGDSWKFIDTIKNLPSVQPEYKPVTADDFAKTMSENTVYSFMAWHGKALELMENEGFVICKKTM